MSWKIWKILFPARPLRDQIHDWRFYTLQCNLIKKCASFFFLVQDIRMFHLVIPPPATSRKPENRCCVNPKTFKNLKKKPEKKMVARSCHWRTLLQICHCFQGSSGGIQLGIIGIIGKRFQYILPKGRKMGGSGGGVNISMISKISFDLVFCGLPLPKTTLYIG